MDATTSWLNILGDFHQEIGVMTAAFGDALPVGLFHSRTLTRGCIIREKASVAITTSSDHSAKIWCVEAGRCVRTFTGHTRMVRSGQLSPNFDLVATCSEDGSVKIWRLADGICLSTLLWENVGYHVDRGGWEHGVTSSAVFSRNGYSLLVSRVNPPFVVIVNASNGTQLRFLGHNDAVNSAVFSQDCHRVLTASDDGTAQISSAESGECLVTFALPGSWVMDAEFSPDEMRIVTVSWDIANAEAQAHGEFEGAKARVTLWSAGGVRLARFAVHDALVRTAVFAPSGAQILTSSADGSAKILSDTGTLVQEFTHGRMLPEAGINSARFSADGRYVITAANDWTARVWCVASGKNVQTLCGHTGTVLFATLST